MTPVTLARILAPRTEMSSGGLVAVYECRASRVESDSIVWVLRRVSIGSTFCGCEIECAIADGDNTWETEKEATGFSHFGCPVEWFKWSKSWDAEWRDAVSKSGKE